MSVADEIEKLAALRDSRALTEAEFQTAKSKALGEEASPKPLSADEVIGSAGGIGINKPSPMKLTAMIILAGVIIFLAFGVVRSNTPEGKEKAKLRAAIDMCWNDYKTSSLGMDARKIIAGTCLLLTDEFKNKYGFNP
ncbi:SHOCT domain-containing protein [Castellaniella hirudinis]|uniref:SHOCT domain-containing protein n=1 Tax=Castellaniella hirudinis TaxID=1144617 RepID=UPI0039C15637